MSRTYSDAHLEIMLAEMVEVARREPFEMISVSQIEVWADGLENDNFFNLIGLKIARSC